MYGLGRLYLLDAAVLVPPKKLKLGKIRIFRKETKGHWIKKFSKRG